MKPLDLSDNAVWKKRFRASSIIWAALAKNNPARGLVCTNKDGIYQLYAWDVPTGSLKQLTDLPAGLYIGMISSDGRHVYYHQDEQGNEIGHYLRVPFEGGEPDDVTPDMPPYASFNIMQSKAGNVSGFMAAGQAGHQVFVMADGGAPRLLYQSERSSFGPVLSADGSLAVIASTERSGTLDHHLLAYDVNSGECVAELWDGAETSVEPGAFSPVIGDSRLLGTTSKSGFNRPLIWNPRTDERFDLPIDHIPGEVNPYDWSPDAKKVILCQLHKAEYQLYIYDVDSQQTTKLNHPPGVYGGFFGGAFFTPEGDIYATWQDSAHPSRLVALDPDTGEIRRTVLEAGDAPEGRAWRSVTFKGANGDDIQAWLATPDGDGPFPTILETHGGPTSVMSQYYSPDSQAWLDHGFAYFTINYHGSTTFGQAFEKSIWGQLGQLEVDDMAAAYHWLVDNGVAQPDAVLLTGASYGGYLTLQTIGKAPDLWAGGMAEVAIADWTLMYEDQAETLRGYQRALFGGTPQEKPEAHRAGSPITYAEQIKAPILVIQGANDTRCPARQMRAYEDKLKSLGKSIQIHWFDAGHGSRAMEQQIEHQELMLRFAYQVLG
jgi:dipeptidyl aminopeptidase/acylaminoacyl peptidase